MKDLTELHLINLISALLIGAVLALPHSPLRIVLGLPFVFLFPGYAFISVLYPRRDDLRDVERLALSCGTSLAIVPLIGLALNFLPWGVRLGPVLVSLIGVTLVCSLWAARTRGQVAASERAGVVVATRLRYPRMLSASHLAVAVTVIALVASVAWRISVMHSYPGMPFTEFYLLGPSGKAEGYPGQIRAGASGEVIVGVTNHELRRVTYRISIQESGRVLETLDPVTLDNGQKWERHVSFRPTLPTGPQEIDLLLFKKGTLNPYRRLRLWIQVLPQ